VISSDRHDPITPDCVGPIALPPGLMATLHSLAAAAGADDFASLSICAATLGARLSRPGTDCRVQVIRGAHETIVPAAGAPDLSAGFRSALRRAAQPTSAVAGNATDERPVVVTLVVSRDGQQLYVENRTNSSDTPSATSWGRAFLQLLAHMASEPDAPMFGHPLVGTEERDWILHGLNPHRRPDIAYRTMAEPFEEQVERSPNAVALLAENGDTVSYRGLNERSNRLGHYLRERGAGPGTRIGICLERGIHQVIAIYAAVKTGAAYVPVDADLPNERIAWILDDSAPRHVLTDPVGRGRIPDGAWEIHDVHDDRVWADRPVTNPVVDGTAAALIHILYTSGTTGRPKGVASPTAGTLANVFWMQRQYPFHEDDTALFKASPGFDISIWEIFWPLYYGARVVICQPGAERDPRHLARMAEAHRASMVFLVPTMMTSFLSEISPVRADALRWVVCGGEPMSPRIRDTFYAMLPASRLVNAFGPTEAGPVTDNVVDPDADGVFVPVGRPADNFRVSLLDANLDLVPIGAPAEAYISGHVGLAEGYWRASAKSAERFVADPFGPPGSRMYRTGDLCRYREDGALEHLGRIDRQVKIRGLRVEPGEIESVLVAHPAVGDCAVIAHGQPPRLLAFVVPVGRKAATDLDIAAIGEHAAGFLPANMRPEQIVPVERLPATVNGKIDQEALSNIWEARSGRERAVEPPADELEAILVEIYHRVLDTSPVSVLDNFVQLGGHSMLALRLLDECTATLHTAPDVTELLTGTLRDVAATVRAAGRPAAGDDGATVPGPVGREMEVGLGHAHDKRHRGAH
jgi:amino acid adenylation domain-containing protein